MKEYKLPPKKYEEQAFITAFDKSRQKDLLKGAGMSADLIALPKMVQDTIKYYQATDKEFCFGRKEGEVGEESGVKWKSPQKNEADKGGS